jgi:sphingomyelin phosphodiesterase
MILWLGDNNAHDIWQQDEEHQVDNTYDATQKIMQYFPNAAVYPMFGNHEPYPADQYDFISNSTQWLNDRLAEMWKPWMDEKALKTFKEQSYYATVNEKFNVKVIALDMLACDTADFYLLRNPTDPNHQLEWLRKELYESEAKGQGVYLLGHIPPGDYGCIAEWSYRYRALVDRFTNIVRGQFFGHSHNDHFETVRSFSDNSAVGTIFISPSLTTFSNLLPAIRIYEMDAETNQPINYHQFRLDLDKWNKNLTGPIDWDHVYSAIQEYNLKDMSFASFDGIADKILTDKETAGKYVRHIYDQDIENVSKRDLQHLHCSAKHSVSEDGFRCLGLDATIGDLMAIAKQMIPGGWYYDKC